MIVQSLTYRYSPTNLTEGLIPWQLVH